MKIKEKINFIFLSLLAGIAIGTVMMVNTELNSSCSLLGAAIFPFGIIFVCATGSLLYTGKVGSWLVNSPEVRLVNSPEVRPVNSLGWMLLFNILGALLVRSIISVEVTFPVFSFGTFLKSILTGIMVVCAVKCYGKGSLAGCWASIFFFVILKCPHCIALAYGLGLKEVGVWCLVMAGNTIGGVVSEAALALSFPKKS